MKRLAIITENERFYNKVRLLVGEEFEVLPMAAELPSEKLDLCVYDTALPSPAPDGSIQIMGARFSLSELKEQLCSHTAVDVKHTLTLSETDSAAVLSGKIIKLTDTEWRLLSLLVRADGFVERGKILSAVFGEGASESAVNVYVHYLREKLESGGEKVIVSSRKHGYKIDPRWRTE